MDTETKTEFNKVHKELATVHDEFGSVHKQLAEFRAEFGNVDKRFTEVRAEFDNVNQELSKINGRLDRFITFAITHFVTKTELDESFAKLKESLPSKEDFSNLMSRIDGYSKEIKEMREESSIMGFKTTKLESWAIKTGTKIGLNYNP